MQKVYQLQDENKTEELYRYLLIVQCNELNSALPKMFQRLNDYTELLLPDNLLRDGSVLEQMVSLIPEDDWKDQVQIIGWLYQYYNTELKDKVFADLKKKVKISKDSIPAATQLFTPDWIVRYMVDNSLGRMWYEGHPSESFKEKLKYYIDDAKQEADVQAQIDAIKQKYSQLEPEEIRCIDPCCGSGHVLVYFFDVLMSIYQEYGYSTREAAISIVANNIWGLDIDERAAQLAYFSIMMKARAYDRRFFSRKIQPHVYEIRESNNLDQASLEQIYQENKNIAPAIKKTLDELYDAKEYGSILQTKQQDWKLVYDELLSTDLIYDELIQNELIPILEVAQALSQQYDVVVTNPPYMGSSGMDKKLSSYVKKHFPNSKADMFAVFIEVCGSLAKDNGLYGMITQQSWMFLSSFKKLRKELQKKTTVNMVHLGARAFDEIGGEVVQTTTFVKLNDYIRDLNGKYVRLVEVDGEKNQRNIYLEEISRKSPSLIFCVSDSQFDHIPGAPIAYWASDQLIKDFEFPTISSIVTPKVGLQTGDNDRFLRLWFEPNFKKINFHATSLEDAKESGKKWFPYNKGGRYRKWYGNNDYVVNWENDGFEIKNFKDEKGNQRSVLRNTNDYFKEGITWSDLATGKFAARFIPSGNLFDTTGPTMPFDDRDNLLYVLGCINSKPFQLLLDVTCPGLHYTNGTVSKLPITILSEVKSRIDDLVKNNIHISREEWDSYELSWNFRKQPLVREVDTIEKAYLQWSEEANERVSLLKTYEEKINSLFINVYKIQNEANSIEEDVDITLRRPEVKPDICSFISYAVGCMFGRYSLDKEGLIYAGGEWDPSQYKTYCADEDNILPITDDDYFEDDIVDRFVKFVEIVYGTDTLEENGSV